MSRIEISPGWMIRDASAWWSWTLLNLRRGYHDSGCWKPSLNSRQKNLSLCWCVSETSSSAPSENSRCSQCGESQIAARKRRARVWSARRSRFAAALARQEEVENGLNFLHLHAAPGLYSGIVANNYIAALVAPQRTVMPAPEYTVPYRRLTSVAYTERKDRCAKRPATITQQRLAAPEWTPARACSRDHPYSMAHVFYWLRSQYGKFTEKKNWSCVTKISNAAVPYGAGCRVLRGLWAYGTRLRLLGIHL